MDRMGNNMTEHDITNTPVDADPVEAWQSIYPNMTNDQIVELWKMMAAFVGTKIDREAMIRIVEDSLPADRHDSDDLYSTIARNVRTIADQERRIADQERTIELYREAIALMKRANDMHKSL
jgi:hypothetical protein